MKSKIEKINNNPYWKFFNKPLIIILFGLIAYSLWGYDEKRPCTISIAINEDALTTNYNYSDSLITTMKEYYSTNFVSNYTFDSYQDALSYRQLLVDIERKVDWYKFSLICDEDTIKVPSDPREYFINR